MTTPTPNPTRKSFIESQESTIESQESTRTFIFPETKNYCYDKLDQIFADQKNFKQQIDSKFENQEFSCYNFKKQLFDIDYDLNNVITEAAEAKSLLRLKKWSEKDIELTLELREKILEELIDVSKFLNQAIINLGYSAADYYDMHMKKSEINKKRQKNNY